MSLEPEKFNVNPVWNAMSTYAFLLSKLKVLICLSLFFGILYPSTPQLNPSDFHSPAEKPPMKKVTARPVSASKIGSVADEQMPPLGNAYTIPVVFHIVSQNPYAITDQQVINAVKDLNDAFAHAGAYAGGQGANTGISFCLARIDPDGGNTTGITRTESVLGDFDQDIENDRLKNLISWDTKQYCNIWLVDGIKSELLTTFSCGSWTRHHENGYAGLGGDGDYRDGIVIGEFGPLMAHEMGHYLGLSHIFVQGSCANTNCSVDGDGVCDTPPMSSLGGSCTNPQNSCYTDSLSGFAHDVPDLNSNFMSLSGACTNEFTAGQAAKMKNNLVNVRSGLISQNKCTSSCSENIIANFTRNNWFPATGDLIQFTSTSTGGTNYQWSVNGNVVGGNSPNFSQNFSMPGKYKVTLKVYNANPNCYANYTDYVIVTCGVMARFYPDKRVIASKDPIYLDTILFTNRSVNATSFSWLMSNDQGMAEQVVSTAKDLDYIFRTPGNYTVRLIAGNGSCSDTTSTFSFTVKDPTPDGAIAFTDIECYQQTKLKISLYVCDYGYAPILPNTPITFYDGDPKTDTANKLGTFLVPDSIIGSCCGKLYDYIVDIHKPGLNQLYGVFNDNGSTKPLQLPNTNLIESNYANNILLKTNFQFKASVAPPSATLQPGDTLQLSGQGSPGKVTSYLWSDSLGMSCVDCANPFYIAGRSDITKKLVVMSELGCVDSAFANIKVPVVDDYTMTIDQVECSKNDSLQIHFTVCNNFKRGGIPQGIPVAFYDGDPTTSNAKLLGPVFINNQAAQSKCVAYTNITRGTKAGTIYGVVNNRGIQIPIKLPDDSTFMENNYSNNIASFNYLPDTISVEPADTSVFADHSLVLKISSTVYDASSVKWMEGEGYKLNCTNCLSPMVEVSDNSVVQVQMLNQLGCLINGQSKIKVISPDLTVQILDAKCYTNDSLLVKFSICMNNQYDSVFKGIPVAFYDADPSAGAASLLNPVFYTPSEVVGNCQTYSTVIKYPTTEAVYAVVNSKGNYNTQGDTSFNETDYTNNIAQKTIQPFSVVIEPADTTLFKSTSVPLTTAISGGQATTYIWEPAEFLSCNNCAAPVATPSYSVEYKVHVKNEFNCVATGTSAVKIFTGGKVNIPNGFTPNGDGRNDIFFIMGNKDLQMLEDFSIFNRWGQKIFQVTHVPPNDPRFGWDGYINGTLAETGTYVYFVKIAFSDGTQQVFKGTVTLIR
ncbi:MAG: hypothetical protein C5B59_16885 [Bacteroidetes bacterium]|nr:MAG: hypothetical protein C5B59_16885 [Bacteroidota bacterium]